MGVKNVRWSAAAAGVAMIATEETANCVCAAAGVGSCGCATDGQTGKGNSAAVTNRAVAVEKELLVSRGGCTIRRC